MKRGADLSVDSVEPGIFAVWVQRLWPEVEEDSGSGKDATGDAGETGVSATSSVESVVEDDYCGVGTGGLD